MVPAADGAELRIAAVGEILWDLFETVRYLGGAPFNFVVHAGRLGHRALLVSAVGEDEPGRTALARMRALGAGSEFISVSTELKTGTVTVRVNAGGEPGFTIHHPAAYDRIRFTAAQQRALAAFQPGWIYFGTLQPHSDLGGPCATLLDVLAAAPDALRFYDVNLRPASYTIPVVMRLLDLANAVKLNLSEAQLLADVMGLALYPLESFCGNCLKRFSLRAICVTKGAAGCAILIGGQYAEAPGFRVQVADTVGSGDAFSAAFLHGLASGWPIDRIAEFANRVGALVASRAGGTPEWTLAEALALEGLA